VFVKLNNYRYVNMKWAFAFTFATLCILASAVSLEDTSDHMRIKKGHPCWPGEKCAHGLSCVGRPHKMRCLPKRKVGEKCGHDPFWVSRRAVVATGDMMFVLVNSVVSGRVGIRSVCNPGKSGRSVVGIRSGCAIRASFAGTTFASTRMPEVGRIISFLQVV